ncbi:MAG: glycosyltransferase [Pseudorhodoplanes sp.]|nr:glycosyltransferase [Pseudorhodoplanes sp.]
MPSPDHQTARTDGTRSGPISFFIQDLRAGGAERSVVRLVNGIAERGFDVDLVLVNRTGPFLSELNPKVTVVELPQQRTLTAALGLRAYMARSKPAAIVSSMTHTNVAAIIARLGASWRPRLVVVEHNNFQQNRAIRRGLARLSYEAVPLLYRFADVVAVVANDMRESLAKAARIPAQAIETLYNPVVTPELAVKAAAAPAHPWLTPPLERPVFVGVGRFDRQKNFPLLIEAFAIARKRMPCRLVILGEGTLRPQLERLVAEAGLESDVDLPGFDANPFSILSRATALVMSSDWEGLPTVVIEALACGCPVVSTDCPTGPREILQGGEYGRLVAPGDAAALADAMIATAREPIDRDRLKERAAAFNLDRAVDRYLEVARVR